jgi:outer membrane protein OmpA-like peptidoglycan-associated protein
LPPVGKSQKEPSVGVPGPKRFEDVRKDRRERVEDGGRRKIIQEPGNRMIVKENNRAVIRHDEAERFSRRPGARSERRADGNVETYYVRGDGVRIVTVVDSRGRLLRRYRRDRDGRERNIIDNRRFYRNLGVGVGIGVIGGIIALNLPPPRVTIPRDRYIVDYEDASDDDLYDTLDAPPVEDLDRSYSLEEIRDNYQLRARVRRIDLDTINFEFGAWEVGPDQHHKLERIARAILRLLERNPEAVVMIEGHTDAVGSDEDNLSLSDRRASAVAEILSDQFDVPPENLVTQGYGEEHLKVDTQEPERLNRRVTILNITGLMAER